MRAWVIVLLSFVVFTETTGGLADVNCPINRTETVSLHDRGLPQLPKAYRVQISGTVVLEATTFTAEEYVDTVRKRATIAVKRGNGWDKTILNGATNQTFKIKNGACTVQHNTDPLDQYPGTPDDQPYPLTIFSLMKLAQSKQVYLGNSIVRGLKTNHWQSCSHWPGVNGTVRLDLYFSVSTDPVKTYDKPVRSEVKGQGVYLIYDYYGFAADVDPSVFQTPSMTACPGRTPTSTIPKLKSHFRYRMETKSMNSITDTDVWYDFSSKLVRQDHKASCKGTLCNPHSFTEIQDYKTGVSYTMDHTANNCTVHPTGRHTWLAKQDKDGIRINTPQEMFFFDDTFVYIGERSHRGIDCSVYSGLKRDLHEYHDMDMNVEIYFMNNGLHGRADLTTKTKPVMIHIYNTTFNLETVIDVFEFSDEPASVSDVFDISSCFDNSQKKKLTITFPTDANTPMPDMSSLTASLKGELTKTVGLNPIRVQKMDIRWDEHIMYFTSTILDKPPPEAKFHQSNELVPQYRGDLTLPGVISLEACAGTCDDQTFATCNSFDVCPNSCALFLHYNSTGRVQSPGKLCRHYSRVVSCPVDHELTLSDAYSGIEHIVRNGSFSININVQDKGVHFVATSITDKETQTTASQAKKHSNPMAVLNRFDLKRNVQLMENHFPIVAVNESDISLEDCAYRCMSELVFTCLAFGYWHQTGICSMHSLYPYQNPDLIAPCDGCDLYTRNWLQQYATIPTSLVPPGATTLTKIHDSNYCAMACVRLYECNTFYYSSSQLTCILIKPHTPLHSNTATAASDWKYYTRVYTDDFMMTSFRGIWQDASKGYNEALQDDCAKYCVEETSFRCQMFTWCEDYTMCSLFTVSLYDTDHVSTFAATKCWIYNREYNTDGSRFIPQFSHNASLPTPSVINTTPQTTPNTTLMSLNMSGGSDDSPIAPANKVSTMISTPATKIVSRSTQSSRVTEPHNTNKGISTSPKPNKTTKTKTAKVGTSNSTTAKVTSVAHSTMTSDNASTTRGKDASTLASNNTNVTRKPMSFASSTTSKMTVNATVPTTNSNHTINSSRTQFNTTLPSQNNTTLPTTNVTNGMTSLPSHVNTTLPTDNVTNGMTSLRSHANTTFPTANVTKGMTWLPSHANTTFPNTTFPTANVTKGMTSLPSHVNTTFPTANVTKEMTSLSSKANTTLPTANVTKGMTSLPSQDNTTIHPATPCSHVTQTPCVCPSETSTAKSSGGGEPECHPLTSTAKSSYPTGTVAGVAVGMLVLGVIIGVAAIFLKNRYSTGSYNFSGKTFKNASYSP